MFQLILFQTELVHKRTISYLSEAYRRNCIETGLLEYGLPKFQTEMKDLVLEIFITFVKLSHFFYDYNVYTSLLYKTKFVKDRAILCADILHQ